MSDETSGLQFERAELDGAPAAPAEPSRTVACAACGAAVDSYFTVNGRVACGPCRDAAVRQHQAPHALPLAKATLYGLGAAVAGAVLYYAVARLTGYEIGLVSIVVGLLVGKAVKSGAGGRGGRRYQALAVALCYLSIASSYGAFVVQEILKQREAGAAAQQAAPSAGAAATPPAATPAAASPAAATASAEEGAPGGLAIAAEIFLLLVKLPVLIGLDSPMTFVLVGIALWEAWKINGASAFATAGPFAVGASAAAHG